MKKINVITLGCSKNTVDSEHLMAQLAAAGYTVTHDSDRTDAKVVVINTCGFIEPAKEESIEAIFEMARYKQTGRLKKLFVTGCLAQRYIDDLYREMPEVDGILGTGSYTEIVPAIEKLLNGEQVVDFGSIDAPEVETGRIMTTAGHYAFIKIAEGCDNWCAFCIIPKLRGRYRSRPMDKVLAEARSLADRGVKELIVIAQDITRYGTDWDGERHLADLLEELVKLNFHWIRLHYLYPEQIDDRLIDVIAREEKILNYLDIPLQHCNDAILKRMNRQGDKAYIEALLAKLKSRIPGLVLRTSLITGLPYEDEAAFEELCGFLEEQKLQRVGAFAYSPEEGTPAAKMLNRVDTEEAQRRAELVMEVQSQVMDQFNDSRMGDTVEVLCDGWDGQSMSYVGRSYAESPGIDGNIYFTSDQPVEAGDFVRVRITGAMDGELTGERTEE